MKSIKNCFKSLLSISLVLLLLISTIFVGNATTFDTNNLLAKKTNKTDWMVSNTQAVKVSQVSCDESGVDVTMTGSFWYKVIYTPLTLEAGTEHHLSFKYQSLYQLNDVYIIPRDADSPVVDGKNPRYENDSDASGNAKHPVLTTTGKITKATSADNIENTYSVDINFTTLEETNKQYVLCISFLTMPDGVTAPETIVNTFSDMRLYAEDKETSANNLWNNISASDWDGYQWNTYAQGRIVETTDSRYGGTAIQNSNVASQNLHTKLPVEPDTTYRMKFSIKVNAISRIELFSLTAGASIPWLGANRLDQDSPYKVTYEMLTVPNGLSESEWTEVNVTFRTGSTVDVDYYLSILFGAKGTLNTAILSDFSLVKQDDANLWNNVRASDWEGYQNNSHAMGKFAYTTDSRYGGTAVKNSNVGSQNLYTKLSVEANTTYRAKFSIKVNAINRIELFSIENGATISWKTNGTLDSTQTVTYKTLTKPETVSESTWADVDVTFTTGVTANKDWYFNILFGAAGTANTAVISDFSLTKGGELTTLKTSYNNEAAIRVASNTDGSIRENGLRTYNSIEKDWISDNIVEYGSIAIRQNYLKGLFEKGKITSEDVSYDNLKNYFGKGVGLGVSYRAEGKETITGDVALNGFWEETDSKVVFTSYLTGIQPEYYGEEYLVCSYAIDEKGDFYYGNVSSISIFKVAQAMDKKYSGEGSLGDTEQNDISAFNNFVGEKTNEYATWCGDGNTGNLYELLIAEQ